MLRRQPSPRRTLDRRGFSMIELLVVIVIIAILMSLLMVGIQSARNTARITQAVAEIRNFEKAIADFKMKFGVEPPSYIVLYEAAAGWSTNNQETRVSRALIREMWPSFNFAGSYDINGDGDAIDVLRLNGAECLAFFIGGLQQVSGTSVVPVGFSANPATPFLGYSGNRVGPFLENMDSSRFVDLDGDGIREYLDPLPGQTNPIQYFSSYGGRGYQLLGLDNALGTPDDEAVMVSGNTTLRSVYNQAAGSTTAPAIPFNKNGFQIISPGFDQEYGYGGFVDIEKGVSSPTGSLDPPNRNMGQPTPLSQERDNITNFKGGQLN